MTTQADATPIGAAGFDHVGITVPDLGEATRFFVDVLGFEKGPLLGPFRADDDWLEVNLDADARATLHIQVVALGSAKVELFGFTSPRGERRHPRRDDVGAASIGLRVDDIDRAIAGLRSSGVELLGGRKDVAEGPIAGTSWIYARAPWGLLIFLSGSTPR